VLWNLQGYFPFAVLPSLMRTCGNIRYYSVRKRLSSLLSETMKIGIIQKNNSRFVLNGFGTRSHFGKYHELQMI